MWDQGLFERALATKYAIMGQNANSESQNANTTAFNADTQRLGMNASVNLDTIRAGLLPGQAKSEEELQKAQATNLAAQANLTNTNARYVGPETLARIGLYKSQGGLYGAQAAEATQNSALTPGFNFGANPISGLDSDSLKAIIYSRLGLPAPQ